LLPDAESPLALMGGTATQMKNTKNTGKTVKKKVKK
jgi:hypothetical protein